jgi:cytochrome c-type biogenesis protein CcmH/NrfG
MSPGLPGTGIGGLFYILSALVMPICEACSVVTGRPSERPRRVIVMQFAIAAGALVALWLAGWLLGLILLNPSTADALLDPSRKGQARIAVNVVHYVSLLSTTLLLLLVMATVQLLRLSERHRRGSARGGTLTRILRRALVIAILVGPVMLAPKTAHGESTSQALLLRADKAFKAGLWEEARLGYEEVLSLDQECSRAVYRLAQLQRPGSVEAVVLLQRYVALEPEDAWGHMALGDAVANTGSIDGALAHFNRAALLAPSEPDVWIGQGRILTECGRVDAAVLVHEQWVQANPGDPEAWRQLGDARQRAFRYREAAAAFERSLSIADDPSTRSRLDAVVRRSAAVVTPYASYSRDSDGYVVRRFGLRGDAVALHRFRLGFQTGRLAASDGHVDATMEEACMTMRWRPRRALDVRASVGGSWLPEGTSGSQARSEPVAKLRVRWRRPQNGTAIDVRMARTPVAATPELLIGHVVLEEARGRVERSLVGPFRIHAAGRYGILHHQAQDNTRTGYGGGLTLAAGPWPTLSVNYSELRYARAAQVGYFAPERVETTEASSFIEYELDRGIALSVAMDMGAGVQRVLKFGGAANEWGPVFRLWGMVNWQMLDALDLGLEVEAYKSKIAPEVASAAEWRYVSVELFFRWIV